MGACEPVRAVRGVEGFPQKPETRSRETVIPTSGKAFNRPAGRPKDGRLNAEEKPAKTRIATRDPRGSRNRGGRPLDVHHGEPKAKEAEPPDRERGPYARSEALRRFFRIGATDGRKQ